MSMIYRSLANRSLVKRGMDITMAIAGLTMTWPVIAVAGLVVKCDSKGPLFYRSRRLGRGFVPFDVLKLRTMVDTQPNSALQVTSANDPRMTRVGRFLRRTKIDELPQLWNVLVGEMSLVGPRPEVERYVALFQQDYEILLKVRPGLTDRATLMFVDEEQRLATSSEPERYYREVVLPQKIAVAKAYVQEKQSLCEDVSILTATAWCLLRRFGKSY